jgi:hypothetical protein
MWQFVLVIIVEVYIWIALALSISKYHPKLLLPPWCPCIGLLSHTEFLHMLTSLPVTRVGGVRVYTWIALALPISLDFWLRWLVHEA